MLGDQESALVALIQKTAVGKRLRLVSTLPDLPDEDILKRWRAEAPSVYVVPGDGGIELNAVSMPFSLVLVATNARGHEAARRGDGRVIGLYEMLDGLIAELHEARFGSGALYCDRYEWLQDKGLRDNGLFAVMLQVQTSAAIPEPDISGLDEFDELYASWGVVPQGEQDGKPLAEALIPLVNGEIPGE